MIAAPDGDPDGNRRKRYTQGEVIDAAGEEISESIVRHTIGFIQIADGRGTPMAKLVGTGTLVRVGGTRAILTAWHVIDHLPKNGRIGIIISKQLHSASIDVDQFRAVSIGNGVKPSVGPDLGVLVLSADVANSIAAKQVFYNLDLRKGYGDTTLKFEGGLWSMTGFIDEWTIDGPGLKQKGFRCFSGMGKPKRRFKHGGFDYYDFDVDHGSSANTPGSFGGMSGGGLWYATLKRGDDGQPKMKSLLLCGVAFYQSAVSVDSRTIRFHGQQSIYESAYRTIDSN